LFFKITPSLLAVAISVVELLVSNFLFNLDLTRFLLCLQSEPGIEVALPYGSDTVITALLPITSSLIRRISTFFPRLLSMFDFNDFIKCSRLGSPSFLEAADESGVKNKRAMTPRSLNQ